jgi:hypothetical protein
MLIQRPFFSLKIVLCLSMLLILLVGMPESADASTQGQDQPPVNQTIMAGDTTSVDAPSACAWSDDFSNTATGWYTLVDTHHNIRYEGGIYKMGLMDPHDSYKSTQGTTRSQSNCENARVVVDAIVVSDDYHGGLHNLYGITFGFDFGTLTRYMYNIYTDGYFELVKSVNFVDTTLIPRTQSAWINPTVANHPFVNVHDKQIVIGINNHVLGVYIDPAYAIGNQGLTAGYLTGHFFEVDYDNFTQTASSHYYFTYIPMIQK